MSGKGLVVFLCLPTLLLIGGCQTAPPAGLDRAVEAAHAGILKQYPEQRADNLRLKSIYPIERYSPTNASYAVTFEELSSIQVTINHRRFKKETRSLTACVAADGTVTSTSTSRSGVSGKIHRPKMAREQ